jgi:hypothetical protein
VPSGARRGPSPLLAVQSRVATGCQGLECGHGLVDRFEGRGLVANIAREAGKLELGVGQLQAIFGPCGRIITKVVAEGAEKSQGHLEQLIT